MYSKEYRKAVVEEIDAAMRMWAEGGQEMDEAEYLADVVLSRIVPKMQARALLEAAENHERIYGQRSAEGIKQSTVASRILRSQAEGLDKGCGPRYSQSRREEAW